MNEKLQTILKVRREAGQRLLEEKPLSLWIQEASQAPRVPSFREALKASKLGIIAEIKRASPSAGDIQAGADPLRLAEAYQEGGASAISILTEPTAFKGRLEDLAAVKRSTRLPLLRKDFLFSEAQVCEAKLAGASAVLLIVRFLADQEIVSFKETADAVGLDILCEVHDEEDLDRASRWDFPILGVNCRNLQTMAVSLEVHEQMAPLLPSDSLVVAESGIKDAKGLQRVSDLGYDAVLMGEAVMRQPDPASFLRDLLGSVPGL